jgi:hypothetical protein
MHGLEILLAFVVNAPHQRISIPNPKLQVQHPQTRTSNPRCALHPKPSTLNAKCKTPNPKTGGFYLCPARVTSTNSTPPREFTESLDGVMRPLQFQQKCGIKLLADPKQYTGDFKPKTSSPHSESDDGPLVSESSGRFPFSSSFSLARRMRSSQALNASRIIIIASE